MAGQLHPDEAKMVDQWLADNHGQPLYCQRRHHELTVPSDHAERVRLGSRDVIAITCPRCGCVELFAMPLP